MRRIRARVEGTVQGVGFRPFVYRLAAELELAGFVRNDERGVLVEVEGGEGAVEGFLRRLAAEAPPLAAVEAVRPRDLTPAGEHGFRILASPRGGEPEALVSPDTATCDDCLAELFDPADRRHRYPFVNCTNCGPRFTIVRGVPYDRPNTTMAEFAMCPACRAEYDDPRDRRFHAQPIACPVCGPVVRLVGAGVSTAVDTVAAAAELLRGGAILAVKGLGGYHLACRADDEAAVAALRARKHREDKPFALLVRDLDAAEALARVGRAEANLLASPARPIVLLARRAGVRVARSVAPASRELGLMLPYTPLHHLLAGGAGVPLVLTSGNLSDEPIAYEDDDALERLAPVADAFLLHDRPIRTRTDDSVARVVRGRPLLLRRSRGYVPGAIPLPVEAAPPVLACGAELKSTFCLAAGRRAWVGHHIGDLKNLETLEAYRDGVAHFEGLFDVRPQVVAHDLHPDYLSTAYALEREGVRFAPVQHHHAHLAAVLAEHGEAGPAVGAIYDGAGLGPDGTVWGGELLLGGLAGFERAGHLRAVPQPGGDRAARQGWRMACSWLDAAGALEVVPPPPLRSAVPPGTWRAVAGMARTGFAAPLTSSAGRLFDAVAALCGVRAESTYEGQAAIELEACADPEERGHYEIAVGADLVLDPRCAIRAVARDAVRGVPAPAVSARFHRGLAEATARACGALARRAGVSLVVLGGGVWANRRLLEQTARRLEDRGLRVLVPERLPPGDGGLSYGQAAVAAARS